MHDCFQARVYVYLAITLTATLALMLCYLDVIDSMSLSFNPTYRIERCLLFWASVASSWKCRDRLGTRKKFRVNRPDFQHNPDNIPTYSCWSIGKRHCSSCISDSRPEWSPDGLFFPTSHNCPQIISHITFTSENLLSVVWLGPWQDLGQVGQRSGGRRAKMLC